MALVGGKPWVSIIKVRVPYRCINHPKNHRRLDTLTIDRERLKQIVEQELKKMRAEVNAAHDDKGRFAKKN